MPLGKRTTSGVLGGLLGLVGLSAVAGVLVTATVTPAIAVSGYAASSAITLFDNLPSYLKVDEPMLPTTIYADDPHSDGHIELASFYDQNRTPVEYDEVATVMYDSILSSEDPRYYEHGGVDLIGTTRAVLNNFSGGDTQGGSSISQQYVKNVLIQQCEQEAAPEELQACWIEATQAEGIDGYERKLQEMRYAIAIEKEYSKNDILLGYLNIANFGGVTYGIEAASQYYFGVSAKDLTIVQAATLAGIVQNPNYYRIDQPEREDNGEANGYAAAKDRRNYVLTRLHQDGKITDAEYEEAHAAPVEPEIHPRKQGCREAGGSAYFCQYVKTIIENDPNYGPEALRRGGLHVYTTLDLNVQMPAEQAMREMAPAYIEGMDFGATGVSLQPETGRILSMVQNTEFNEAAETKAGEKSLVYAADYAHGRSSGFPLGSTFKVFTLLDWLEKGHSINEVLNGVNRQAFTGFHCDGAPITQTSKIDNFNKVGGYTGTIARFTKDSLNSGFLAMGAKLNLCDIMRVADKLNVTTADGKKLSDPTNGFVGPFGLLGSANIAPLAMASVYATIANNGIQCQPKAIDKITSTDGEEMPVPETTCEQKLAPEVAATAAAALSGVMQGGGTGANANTWDGTPLIGKTGTNERDQTALVESSTKATTFVWIGNANSIDTDNDGIGDYKADLFTTWANGRLIKDIRFPLAKAIQAAANAQYPGGQFPPPDPNLSRQILVDLPNVVGKSVDEAKNILWGAGFVPVVGDPVPGTQPEGVIESQNPPPGRLASGTTVTISPSNGKGNEIPDVKGESVSAAIAKITAAGFKAQRGSCDQKEGGGAGRATGTTPQAGSVLPEGTEVLVNYQARKCQGD
ncbi:transglycosylase domain-containing protein [Microbacterium sp. NPDC096154]|uniref:transglycosylase domain-containing protein n=1 Tax=Microbacterium sp. NPDC096154 TaxID=3155549 RepID=UPI003326794D